MFSGVASCVIRIDGASYGRRVALEDVPLCLHAGQGGGLFAHNGAGKTTAVRTAFGLVRAWTGEVTVDGKKLSAVGPIGRLRAGLAFVPQDHGVFPDLSVAEHFDLSRSGGRLGRLEHQDAAAEVLELLPALKDKWRQRAGALSGGQRQLLSIGRSLLPRPRFLFLDEPSLGLAPNLVEDIMEFTRRLASSKGIGVLLVEQNVHQALQVVDEVYVLRSGRIAAHQSAANLANSDSLWELF
jgi:branched-chain amino acid transport system ATP-binding protein